MPKHSHAIYIFYAGCAIASDRLVHNLRRILLMGSGASCFLARPMVLVILAATAVSLCLAVRSELKKLKKKNAEPVAMESENP